jgi:hypothetical protein
MRRLRILIVIFFLIVLVVFGVTRVREQLTSDYEPPEITADSDTIFLSVNATDAEYLAGMTAYDKKDGDVTNTLVVASKTKFSSKGTLRVNYAAFDNNSNVGTYTREVTYTDYHSPHLSLTSPLRYIEGSTKVDYLTAFSADDCIDGNISTKIRVSTGNKEIVSDELATEPVTVQVTNSAGDTSALELTARYESYADYSQPAPSLSDYIIYATVGDVRPDLRANINGVWSSGAVRRFEATNYSFTDITVNDSGVDYNTPGVYPITYSLSRTLNGEKSTLGTSYAYLILEAAA